MDFSDHTCEECSWWDNINGCWRSQDSRGPDDVACRFFSGSVYDPDDCDDEFPDDYVASAKAGIRNP